MTGDISSRVLGHYRLESRLGEGGMGVVYLAHDNQLQRNVAVKVVSDEPLDEHARQQLISEARTASSLNHPNICTIHEVGENDGLTYIVMEYVDGSPLSKLIPPRGLPWETLLPYSIQIADALAHAHQHNIVHCDLKSANVAITREGRAKVLDFGLARRTIAPQLDTATVSNEQITSKTSIAGTLHYLSPEALQGKGMDARSDIWSFGVLLYEMTAGRLPFTGNTGFEVTAAILREPPAPMPADVPAGLRAVILRCLTKEPGQRYQRAEEVRAALEALQSQGSIPVSSLGRSTRLWLPVTAVVLAAVVVLGLGFGLGRRFWERPVSPGTKTAPVVTVRRSLAVLGFKNQSVRPDTAWLSTALGEMLTTELSAGGELRTISAEDVARAKSELAVGDAESLAADTLARVRKNLGTDLVLLGSYTALGADGQGPLRLDLRVQDARAGETVATFSETGTMAGLFDLVSRAGGDLRGKLGLGQISPEEKTAVQAATPSTPESARLYAEGLDQLRRFDFAKARDLLEQAVKADLDYPLAHSALAVAWAGAGYDDRAREESQRAFDLSPRLAREQRMAVEGRHWQDAHEWGKAADTYRKLWELYPDNLDYGLSLAATQTSGGAGKDALTVIQSLRKLPAPERDDPRIDYAEAVAAMSLGDSKHALAAATRAVEQGKARGAPLLAAKALVQQSRALFNLGQPDQAKQSLDESKNISEAGKDPLGTAQALTGLGNVAYVKGDLGGALKTYEESLALYLKAGNRRAAATSFSNIGNVISDQGDYKNARKMYDQALSNSREIRDKAGEVMALNNLAGVDYREGNLAGAKSRFEQAAAIAHETGDQSTEASVELNLGSVLLDLGNLAQAKEKKEQSLSIYRQIGDRSSIATSLFDLGEILRIQGDLVGATSRHDEALTIAQELGERATIAMNRLALAVLYAEQGRPADAEAAAHQAAEEYQAEARPDDQASALRVLAQLHLEQGKLTEAEKEIAQVNAIAEKSSDKSLRLRAAIASAMLQAASGHAQEASKSLMATTASAKTSGLLEGQFEARLALGEIQMKSGKVAAGRATLANLEKDAQAKGYTLMARQANAAIASAGHAAQ